MQVKTIELEADMRNLVMCRRRGEWTTARIALDVDVFARCSIVTNRSSVFVIF